MQANDKTRVTVDIYGTQYTLTGHTSTDHMRRVAALVNEQMSKINSGSPRLDLPKLAVLAAVNVGDELMRLRRENEQLLKNEFENKGKIEELENLKVETAQELAFVKEQVAEELEFVKAQKAEELEFKSADCGRAGAR